MPRVQYVKKAQPRFRMVNVLNEDGSLKRSPVMLKDGLQKVDKHGRPVFRSVTKKDLSQPLPLQRCDKCGIWIQIGAPYKHITIKTGPFSSQTKVRCSGCPNWQEWEYSSSLSAQLAQITHEGESSLDDLSTDSPDDFRTVAEEIADSIRDFASEQEEKSSNIEDGFGHPTEKSEAFSEFADELNSWADSLADVEIDDLPEPEDEECEECDGSGTVNDEETGEEIECEACGGLGSREADEINEDQLGEWQEQQRDRIRELLGDSPYFNG